MTTPTRSMIPAVTLSILLLGSAASGRAQGTMPMHGMMPQHHQKMADTAMMAGPHHLLAMAYWDNLATFARVLQGDVIRSKSVNLDLARPAVLEMRRSFDQMRQQHQAMSGGPSGPPMAETMPMGEMMKHEMETHLAALGESLRALEQEIRVKAPEPAKVLEHLSDVLKHCDGMMK